MAEIHKLTIEHLRKSFEILWQAVQDRKYNSRGILGDELLNMKDAFDELDRHLTPDATDMESRRICRSYHRRTGEHVSDCPCR